MALSCCRILFPRQSNLCLQYALKSPHVTVKRFSPKLKWREDIKSSQSFHIITRSFRNQKTPSGPKNQIHTTKSESNSFSWIKSTAFVTGVCSCSFLGAMIWKYENVRQIYKDMASEKASRLRFFNEKAFGFRKHLNAIWENLDSSAKLTFGIIAANVAVWILWKVPRLQPGMVRYFSSSAAHPRLSMVLSSFSHISFLHLVVNMYVLLSFAPVATKTFGHEQFSAFYISAGTMSAFASILCQRLLKRPLSMSVGASGAIMGLLGVTGVLYPTAQLQVAFVSEIFPHSFSADSLRAATFTLKIPQGIKAIVLFDLIGLFMGWKVLDHAGHLGGMLFGILYAKYGSKLIWGNRDSVIKVWHDIRGKP